MNIKNIFILAAKRNASDIHLLLGYPPILRIDGKLISVDKLVSDYKFSKLSVKDLNDAIDVLLNKKQKIEFFKKHDLDSSYQINSYRYRVNCFYEKNNISIVARVIKEKLPSLDEIGMPAVIKDLLDLSQGFILVTGPTGCGKSTTLAAMINHINKLYSRHIISLEDPIEYIFKPIKSIISQRQLGTDMLSFANGLKHVLRQDPNVIMIGEMRDLETIATAVTLAETGHLVLATLHTDSAAQTVDRIIDIFPPYQQAQIKSQLASVLSAVISQRLLPQKGGGRLAAREILINNDAVANLIRGGKLIQIKSVIETSSSVGMISLDKHIQQLYRDGKISREVAMRNMSGGKF